MPGQTAGGRRVRAVRPQTGDGRRTREGHAELAADQNLERRNAAGTSSRRRDAAVRLLEDSTEAALNAMEESWKRRERRGKSVVVVDENGGGAGSCTYSVADSILAKTRAFLVKRLPGATFDVFIDSSRFCSTPPESTQFVEAFWRRREPLPGARARWSLLLPGRGTMIRVWRTPRSPSMPR
jgi:hypothetical protein